MARAELNRHRDWADASVSAVVADPTSVVAVVRRLGQLPPAAARERAEAVAGVGGACWQRGDHVGALTALVLRSTLSLAAVAGLEPAADWLAATVDDEEGAAHQLMELVDDALRGDDTAAARADLVVTVLLGPVVLADGPVQPMASLMGATSVVVACRIPGLRHAAWRAFADRLLATAARLEVVDELHQDIALNFSRVCRNEAEVLDDVDANRTARDALVRLAGRLAELPADVAATHLIHLADAELALWRTGADPSSLDAALDWASRAVDLAVPTSLPRLRDSYARILTAADNHHHAIAQWRLAIAEQRDAADEDLYLWTALHVNLASGLAVHANSRLDAHGLDESISIYEQLLVRGDQTQLATVHAGLASRLRQRYELTSDPSDLDRSIDHGEHSLELDVGRSVARATALNNQAMRLRRRFEDRARMADLDRALELQEEALALLPASRRREVADFSANKSHLHRLRFEAAGARADRVQAAWLARRAVRRGRSGLALNARAALDAGATGLDAEALRSLVAITREAASLATDAGDRLVALGNLAAVSAQLAEESADEAVAREALEVASDALALCPARHVERAGLLTTLGAICEMLATITGEPSWLLRGIVHHREALATIVAAGHRGHASFTTRTNLANALARLGEATVDMAALDEAILLADEAVTALLPGPNAYAGLLARGGAALTRFELSTDYTGTASLADGELAIESYRQAWALVAGDPARAPKAAGNVANALFVVGSVTKDESLLEDSLNWFEAATARVGAEDADRPRRLCNLGYVGLAAAAASPDPEGKEHDLAIAAAAFAEALEESSLDRGGSPPPDLSIRLLVGSARVAAGRNDPGSAAGQAERALVAAVGAVRTARDPRFVENVARSSGSLAALGGLAYARMDEPERAVGFVERALAVHREASQRSASPWRSDVEGAHATSDDVGLASVRIVAAGSDGLAACLVAYFLGDDDGGVVLVVEPDGTVTARDEPFLASPVAGRVATRLGRLVNAARSPTGLLRLRHAVNELTDELPGSLADFLVRHAGGHPIALIPVGSLRALPWHAMGHGATVLAARHRVSYLPAAVPRPRRVAPSDSALLARDTSDASLSTQAELDACAASLRAAGLDPVAVTAAMSLAELDVLLGTARIIHVAGHAPNQWRSSAATVRLGTVDLAAADLLGRQLAAELTTLSACSTYRPDLLAPDAGVTLADAALFAGSRFVLSSMWPLTDCWASDHVPDVYRMFGRQSGVPDAYMQFVAEVCGDEPFRWAGLALSGR